MKKNVLLFGAIAGLITSAWTVGATSLCYRSGNFEGSMFLGYASMVIAFSMVFVGVKSYRDKYNHGLISFGEALKIGSLITLVASTVYVLTWLVDYYIFIPDFMDRYSAHMIADAQKSGESATRIAEKTSEIAKMKDMYNSPVWVVLFTYMEILPVGLIISVIAALILKRKDYNDNLVTS